MKGKTSGIGKLKIGISIKSILLILAVIVCAIFVIFSKNVNQTSEATKLELLRSMKYTQVNNENGIIDNCDYVRFNAFFTRDLNNDGNAEMLLGTCREVGYTDTLYMDLNVLTEGYLENGVIEINSSNFNYSMNMVKDNVLKYNYISNNVKKIQLNKINAGTQKLILGDVLASIGNNINNYSNISTITLKGTHVTDDGQTKTQINKTIKLTVDWHGTTKASISASSVYYNFEEFDSDTISFNFYAYESKKQLLLQENFSTIEIPNLNGYAPLEVKCTNSNVEFNYDEETQKLTIKRTSTINENGILTSTLADLNSYNVVVKYPKEAYDQISSYTTLKFPIETKFIGYNNPNDEFENPHISNIAKANLSVIFREKPKGNIYNFNVYIKDKTHVSRPNYRYVISKQDILNAYDSVEPVESKKYVIEWNASRGSEAEVESLIMSETKEYGEKYGDKIDNIIIDDYTVNTGIYFKDATKMLGEIGAISVYNDDTNELIKTFIKEDWDTYTNEAPFKYETPVKHIRVETTAANKNSNFSVYHTKELNIEKIKEDYEKQQVEEMQLLTTYLTGVCNIIGEDAGKATDTDSTYLVSEVSNVAISLSNPKFITQDTYNNQKIHIDAKSTQLGDAKWQNGMFIVELPAEILNLNVNSVVTDKENVEVLAYDVQKLEDKYIIKIITQNAEPESYRITIDVDITPDPRVPNSNATVKLYAYNEYCNKYYNSLEDIYDVNQNNNVAEYVGFDDKSVTFLSETGLITMETITNYDPENKEAITIAPNIVELNKDQKDATINVIVSNNYPNSISDIKVLGKIPFEGNTYILNGKDMKSKFSTLMTSEGIKVPEELKDKIAVYYSENENPNKDLSNSENGWKQIENIVDFSKIKTYLIDFKDVSLDVAKTYSFSYDIQLPEQYDYNLISYSDHAVFYQLDTEGGKLELSTEPNKVGIKRVRYFELDLEKNKKNIETYKVPGAIYKLEYIDSEDNVINRILTTNLDGNIHVTNLYVGLTYKIKEIKAPENYIVNDEIFEFKIEEDENEKLNLVTNSNIQYDEENNVVKINTYNKPKYNVILTKKDLETQELLPNVEFSFNNKKYVTNSDGQIVLNGLNPNEEYTLKEVEARDYYLLEDIRFKLLEDENGNMYIESNNTNFNDAVIVNEEESDFITVSLDLYNEKIPTYSLEIIKVEDNENGGYKTLRDAKFLLKQMDLNVEYTYNTDSSGRININNLYEYIEGKSITGQYILEEIQAPKGYSTNSEKISFKVSKDADNKLKIDIENMAELISIKKVSVSGNKVSIYIRNQPLFTLVKRDTETGKLLANAEFIIYELNQNSEVIGFAKDVNGNYVGKQNANGEYTIVTDESGKIPLPLLDGFYKIVEIGFPDGYEEERKEIYFEIGDNTLKSDDNLQFDENIDKVITINSIEDLVNLNNILTYKDKNTLIKLMRTLDFMEDDSYDNPLDKSFGDINDDGVIEGIKRELTDKDDGYGFKPLSIYGTFDGRNNEIRNLYIKMDNTNKRPTVALFKYCSGTIKNLGLTGSNLSDPTGKINGGIVAELNGGVIRNCYNKNSITTKNYGPLGGIVGKATNAYIYDCYNTGSLDGPEAGGIVGAGNGTVIERCYNEGRIISHQTTAGGPISGYGGGIAKELTNYSAILYCYNKGYVETQAYSPSAGGILGWGKNSSIIGSYNVGDVKAVGTSAHGGGIIGTGSGMSIYGCYYGCSINTGTVTSYGTSTTRSNMTTKSFYDTFAGSSKYWKYVSGSYPVLVRQFEQTVILNVENTVKKFDITAEIGVNSENKCKGGKILGENNIEFIKEDNKSFIESINYNLNSQKEIKIIPNIGYEISNIIINDEVIQFEKNANGEVIIPIGYFQNIKEDKHIVVVFEKINNLIITKVDENDNNIKLSGAKFRIDTIDVLDPNDLIGEIQHGSNSTTTHHFEKYDGKYVSTNNGVSNSVSNSYFPIDLSDYHDKNFILNINASVSSESVNYDYGFARITNSATVPSYTDTTGEIMKIGGTVSSQTYSKTLQGGTTYYLHIGYRKDSSVDRGEDKFIINSIDLICREIINPDDLIGEIQHGSNSSTTHHFENNDGKYVSTNNGVSNSVSNSYFPINLIDYPDNSFTLNINASVSSESVNYDYGFARITNSATVPSYTDTTGEIMKIGGTVSNQMYSKTLQGGRTYYLHIGYRKDGSADGGEDKFIINSINLTCNEIIEKEIEIEIEKEIEVVTNAEGIANLGISINRESIITEIEAPKGYQLDSTPRNVTILSGEIKELTITNKKLDTKLKIIKQDSETNKPLTGAEFKLSNIFNIKEKSKLYTIKGEEQFSSNKQTWNDIQSRNYNISLNTGTAILSNEGELVLDGNTTWNVNNWQEGSYGIYEISVAIDKDFRPVNTTAWYFASCILGGELPYAQKDFGILIDKDGYFAVGYDFGTIYSSNVYALDGEYHTVTLVYAENYIKLIIDGNVITTISFVPTGDDITKIGIGWNGDGVGTAIKGKIKNVKVYDITLSEQEMILSQISDDTNLFNKFNEISLKTNDNGEAEIPLENGKYIVKEINAPEGYVLTEESQIVEIQDNSQEIIIKNTPKKLNITTKVEKTPAQQVEGGTITGKDELPYEKVSYSQTSTKDIIIDPDDGYKIVSIKVNGETIEFKPDENGNVLLDKFTEVKEDKEVVVKFEPIYESNFTLIKQDDFTKQPLEGIQFEIYYLSVGNDFAKDKNGFYIGEKDANGRYFVTTDSNGEVKLSLPSGLYKAVEVKGANGYLLPEKEEDRTIYFRVLANADIEINYIEDLIDLSDNVTNGNTYEGKVIGLIRDLDFNNDKSYKNANDTTTYGDYNGNGIVETIKEELTNKSSIGFKPIGGNPGRAFSGIFDGNCFEIKNIYINSSYGSLFTYILNGELLNLKLVNANITNSSCGGGFAYYCTNSKIYNCGIDGIVKSSSNAPTGGIVYTAINSEIISCYNNADISGVNTAGISSYINSSLVENCYNTGTITSVGPTGGIGYSITNSTIKNSYNTGDVNGKGCSGGISSSISDSVIENCYNTGKITESSAPAGGFAYSISNCKITDFYNTGDVTGPSCVGGMAYSISNSNLEKCYNKGNLLSTNNSTAGIGYTISNSIFKECYNTGNVNSEYSASGDTVGSAGFAITFTNSAAEKCFNEGNVNSKYNVSGFALKADGSNFENCYNKGEIISPSSTATGIANISNGCNFVNVYNKGNISGSGGYSSGIVRTANNSVFDKCHNSGYVYSGPGVSSFVYYATECTITRCYNEGNVKGGGAAAGFIYNIKNSLVQDCYNTGEAQCYAPSGGMFYSTTTSKINNCYNIGGVIDANDVGGIINYCDSNSSINNCYSTAKLNNISSQRKGGIVYNANSATLKNTYYLNTTALSGVYNKSDTPGVTDAKTALQMLSKSFVNQLNLNKDLIETTIPLSNWKYNEKGYPVLDYEIEIYEYNTSTKQEENTSGNTSTGNTTDADFEINYIEDLIDLSNNVTNGNTYEGKKIVLTRNLDFKDVNSYRNPNDKITYGDYDGNGIIETIKNELNTGFKPIGGTPDKAFSGTFDGNGFELKNLYINTNYAALFTYILDGELLNLKLTNANIINSSCGAGFAYFATNSKIYNCGIDGVLSSSSNAPTSGIVYTTKDSEIKDCYNNADISGVCTAGISSYLTNTLIENCYNTGSLRSTGPIGGIGYSISDCTIRNCYNEGAVSGKGCSGGVAGSISNSVIENSYNTGDIIDTSAPAGGLAYNISNCEIYNCYNTGDVTGKAISGGIGSSISNSIIKDSYNTGNITDNSGPAGGLAYSISSCEISNFYNTGDVFSNSGAGGIAQSISKSTLKECYNEGDISSTTNCAAGIGLWISESNFKECYNKGNIISEYTNSSDTTGASGFAITFTNSTAEKCFNEGNVTSKYHGTGFALVADDSKIDNCYNKGIINANNYAGGMIYISTDSELKNLYNQGQVVSNSPNAGITYSATNCSIEQCANLETLKSNAPSAGIVYTASNSNIVKCYNKGNVYGLAVAGGIVYTTSNSVIQDCYNEGNVYSNNPVGGIVYSAYSTIINNCYNTGKLSGNYCIGGIAYSSDEKSSINNCYNTGELITGSNTTGEPIAGIVYNGTMSTLKDTYYLDTIAKSGLYNAVDSEGNVEAKTEAEMKSEDFVNLLNENKSSIETEIPLSNWKYNSEGYPVLDFEIDKYDYNTNIPINKPDYENVESELGITNSKTAKITVHHYLEGTGPEFEKTPVILAPDEVMIGKENHEYSTSPKLNIENYNLIKDENGEYIIPENASGKYTIEGEHIYYYYNVKPLELTVHHYLEGTEDKLSEDEKYFFNENDHYKTTPYEELLEAYEVALVEGTEEKDITENEVVTYYYKKKEYKIITKVEIPESEKEAGRIENGGTILGEGENPYEIVKHGEDSTKDIIATPIDDYKVSSITVNGKVVPFTIQDGVITLNKFENMTEDKEIIVVFEPIVGKVITHHYIQGTTEKLHDDIISVEKVGGVVNTKPIDIEDYKLVDSLGNKDEDGNVVITKEIHEGVEEIIYYYQKAYKITTDVIEHNETYKDGTIKEAVKGGSITDEDVVIHEQVVKYEDSVKIIEIKPDEGYEIVKVQVNGKAIDLKEIDENGNLTLPEGFFKDVEEDIHVEVEFRKVSKVIVKHLEKDTETELSDTTEIIGHEGKEFETTEKIIPFYTLVKEETTDENGEVKETVKITDENKEAIEPNGTMFSDDITIIYWYEKVDANVIERHIEVNAKGEEKELDFIIYDDDTVDSVEISRKEYEDYTSTDVPKEIKQKIEENGLNVIFVSKDDNKVTVTVNSGNATEVWYYYIKQYNITTEVKTHKETVNGTETEVEGGTISKQYKIDENGKEVEDIYEIVNSRADSTKEIKMVPDDGYRIKSVTINDEEIYIDNMVAEDGSLLLPEAYFVDVQEDYHVVVEFERIPAKVIVKYIDEYTKESILEDKVVEGFVNIEYDEPRSEIENYIPAEPEPTNAKGKMTEEAITITYFYKKQFKVTTDVKEHEETDKDGNKVTVKGGKITGEDKTPLETVSRGEASTKIIKAEPDSGYRVSKLTINDIPYDFRHMLNEKGILSIPVFENMQEDKHIVVEFERIPAQIIVKHIDEETGEELTNQEIIKGFVNGDYSTNSKEFAGYQLNVNKLPINANGKMTEEAIVIIYYYNKLKIPEENITPEIPDQPIEIPEYIPEYIPEFKPEDNNSTNIENVKTGDNIFGYAILFVVSIVGIILIIIGKNKKK